MKRLNIVIDTNVLLVSIPPKSRYHWIFQALCNDLFDLSITESIINEYEEIIGEKLNEAIAKNVIRTLLLLPNVKYVNVFFHWNLIEADPDDNKFVDCAISANANYIVTEDKHFNVLKSIDFPKVNVINIEYFRKLISK